MGAEAEAEVAMGIKTKQMIAESDKARNPRLTYCCMAAPIGGVFYLP